MGNHVTVHIRSLFQIILQTRAFFSTYLIVLLFVVLDLSDFVVRCHHLPGSQNLKIGPKLELSLRSSAFTCLRNSLENVFCHTADPNILKNTKMKMHTHAYT